MMKPPLPFGASGERGGPLQKLHGYNVSRYTVYSYGLCGFRAFLWALTYAPLTAYSLRLRAAPLARSLLWSGLALRRSRGRR